MIPVPRRAAPSPRAAGRIGGIRRTGGGECVAWVRTETGC